MGPSVQRDFATLVRAALAKGGYEIGKIDLSPIFLFLGAVLKNGAWYLGLAIKRG